MAVGLRLILLGSTPFVLGRTVGMSASRATWRCPFLRFTGVPCPGCGGTRAFALFARHDSRWRDYNSVLVHYAGLTLAAGVAVECMPDKLRTTVERGGSTLARECSSPWKRGAALSLLVAPAWLCAIRKPAIRGTTRPH